MIRGNSGCILEVESDRIITKKAISDEYSIRLEQQLYKQEKFSEFNKINQIVVPVVIEKKYVHERYQFSMEYFNALDFIGYFDLCSKEKLDFVVDKIIDLIQQYEDNCILTSIDFCIFDEKFEKTVSKLGDVKQQEYLRNIFQSLRVNNLILPVGICHGDLTFSNMLFSEDDIVLIDFLDTFLESPLQDMVKLRQDSYYYWSTLLTKETCDMVKMRIILKYIDGRLMRFFYTKEYYNKYYKLFQFMNLIRVLPYCIDERLSSYVIMCLNESYRI